MMELFSETCNTIARLNQLNNNAMKFTEVDAHWYQTNDNKYAISKPYSPYHSKEQQLTTWGAYHDPKGEQNWTTLGEDYKTRKEAVKACTDHKKG